MRHLIITLLVFISVDSFAVPADVVPVSNNNVDSFCSAFNPGYQVKGTVDSRGYITCLMFNEEKNRWQQFHYSNPSTVLSCPPAGYPEYTDGPDGDGNCSNPNPNYCDTSGAQNEIDSKINSCVADTPNGMTASANYTCDYQSERVTGSCDYTPKDGGDTGGGDTGGGDTGGGDTGGGDTGGGDTGGGDTGGGDTGGGDTGGGDTGGGDTGGGDTGGGDTGEASGNDTAAIISAINKGNDSIANHLNKLLDADVAVNSTLEEQLALYNKYIATAEAANNQMEHMANFTEQELNVLRSMQGEYGTHFDRNYKKLDEVRLAINSSSNTNHADNNKINDNIQGSNSLLASIEQLTKGLGDGSQVANDSLANIEQLTKGLGDNQVASNEKMDDVNNALLALKETLLASDDKDSERNQQLLEAIANLPSLDGDIDKLLEAQNTGNDLLGDIGSGIDDIAGNLDALADLDVSGAGVVPCFANSSCKGYYQTAYPEGLTGLVSDFTDDMRRGGSFAFLDQFNVDVSNAAKPDFSINFDLGRMGNYGRHSFDLPPYVWLFIRACIMFGAAVLSRSLVFGG
ncbi:hypothetical protein MD588_11345 [Photobacterium sp. SDRW27]|uniref:hypothetical protein n=1 Tax=Photobacterium obscurum TaxID=2829490 RepID=UPI0022444F2D|nr:hypothetical protein [Photobacterium obscurum]MCW8329402.1 hypothetical protein [Photobacterium obscurum]